MQRGIVRFSVVLGVLGIVLLGVVVSYVAGRQGVSVAPVRRVEGGQPEQGRQMIKKYGCGGCHTVPGVPGAQGRVGPALDELAWKGYIAGELPNTPDNLIYWIQFPQEVDPGNAMPNVNVTESDARDIAAYLYTLGE